MPRGSAAKSTGAKSAGRSGSLGGSEGRDARRRVAPSAAVVFEAIRREGASELERPALGLMWSGLAAGLSMGFSFLAEALLQAHLPEADWTPLVSKLGYSVGFLIVVLGRQQLFTENTLTPVLEVANAYTTERLRQVGVLWSVVLAANLVGAFGFALALRFGAVVSPEQLPVLSEVAAHAVAEPWGPTFIGAVFAGWLIALMVWLLPFAETGRVGVIVVITYLVGLGGFGHIVAGSVETFFLMLGGELGVAAWLGGHFVPVLLGNVVGGVSLVAAINYAQVKVEG